MSQPSNTPEFGPPVAKVTDLAAWILREYPALCDSGSLPLSGPKLQKLVYYCQVWSLMWDTHPIFADPVLAVGLGPVVPDLLELTREHTRDENGKIQWTDLLEPRNRKALTEAFGDPDLLPESVQKTCKIVVSDYGSLSGSKLTTHAANEKPYWKAMHRQKARSPALEAGIISLAEIHSYHAFPPIRKPG